MDDDDAPPCQGQEPAKVVIESVVPVTAEGLQTLQVTLRNVGLQTANMSGWLLTPGDGKAPDAKPHIFGATNCSDPGNYTLMSGESMQLKPLSIAQCGFSFTLAPRWAAGGVWDCGSAGGALRCSSCAYDCLRVVCTVCLSC
jgi:hypothetical protein